MLKRVIIFDRHPIMVEGLSQLMSARGYVIACATSDATQLIHALLLDKPTLLIMDMAGLSEYHLKKLHAARQCCGPLQLLIYASTDSCWHEIKRLKWQVQGYLSKGFDAEMFNYAVSEIEKGETVMLRSADITPHHTQDQALIASLTNREMQILRELGAGKSNKIIANELHLSNKTVSTYKRSIMQKMHTVKVSDVVDFAQRAGF
ncbi:response regulator transcription factor [Pantoea sp. CTOTU49201]|uniref:response regulator transcription factor n=1 Tax=Pantoea sp. CTOTU49201 TaxID=2953855 RepID=UPI00289C8A93|nr:response regulator transcription factor [Pantoea sp. CTOTU49201]